MISPGTVNDGQWHHVALTAAVDTQSLYLDGACIGSLSGTIGQYDMVKNQIGNGYANSYLTGVNGWAEFNGVIDETRISNIVRNPNTFNLQLPPTNLAAIVSGTTINLNWRNGGGTVPLMRYKIYRGSDSVNISLIDSTSTTAYANSGLLVGIRYFYRISAVDTTGFESAKSFASSAVPAGLVAWYPFNGNANDSSGNGNNGKVNR